MRFELEGSVFSRILVSRTSSLSTSRISREGAVRFVEDNGSVSLYDRNDVENVRGCKRLREDGSNPRGGRADVEACFAALRRRESWRIGVGGTSFRQWERLVQRQLSAAEVWER